jgi:hypothetical protein
MLLKLTPTKMFNNQNRFHGKGKLFLQFVVLGIIYLVSKDLVNKNI